MISFVPYYREERRTVLIRIIADRAIVKVINTGIKLEPEYWDKASKTVINHPNKKILNHKIQTRIAELQREMIKADLLGTNLTRDRVKKIAEGDTITTDFYKHCEKWIREKYRNPATQAQAMSELRKVHAFAPSLQFGDIDKRWLLSYHRYLVEKLKNKGNTPWKALKFIRTMLYDAESIGGIVQDNPFKSREFKMPKYIQPEKDGLYIEELDRIEQLLGEPHPVVIKVMAAKFLFMCYSGLRISDAKRVTAEHIKNGERLVITSKKTGTTTNLKLYGRLSRVLEELKGLPPVNISDQKLNDYLKIIAGLAGITRIPLTTHVGRHSFGCLLAEMGVMEEEAQQLLGHKNKNVTRIYYKLRQPQIDRAADRLNSI